MRKEKEEERNSRLDGKEEENDGKNDEKNLCRSLRLG